MAQSRERQRLNRLAQLRLALHELQVIQGENPSDDIGNAIEDTRYELEQIERRQPCE